MILVDGHVHIYDCYDLKQFLDSALCNFEIMAKQLADERTFSAFLLLAESRQFDWFSLLEACAKGKNSALRKQIDPWKIEQTMDETTIRAVNDDGKGFFVVAGRQIVTRENLEVLALVTKSNLEDGKPLESAVKFALSIGAIPVLSWSVGKWLGKRGEFLRNFLIQAEYLNLFIGDIGGRPSFWPIPSHFQLALQKNIRILAGTDSLPLPSEVWRPGSYGFMISEQLNDSSPSNHLKKLLKDNKSKIVNYGKLENPFRFLRNQLLLRLNKLRKE